MIEAVIVRKDQMTANRWSGGTTTQIDLFPACSTYGARDFAFRVSSATIEESPSQFTPLPDYQRWIAMLSKPVVLEHAFQNREGLERVELVPLQVYPFDGGIPTTSFGKAVDFNLMLRKGLFGKMVHVDAHQRAEFSEDAWVESWLSDRKADARGHLAAFWPEASQAVGSVGNASMDVIYSVDGNKVALQLKRGDYIRLSGKVLALRQVRFELHDAADLLLLYMET
jgi:environmental stress-induced protein Ves